MQQDAHSKKVTKELTIPAGTNTIVPANADAYIYVHEIIGDMSASGNFTIKAGVRTLGAFTLDAGQGLTLQDEPGEDGVPRFECRPGEALIFVTTGGTFNGSIDYSFRY